MGEIRIVGTGKTRGYPYPVCKKGFFPFQNNPDKLDPSSKMDLYTVLIRL